ncbi:EpsG family protein [Raoultella terrigena]|uniref:EpsG family protein n=1 Tax=Raoultella terrigena TaxID=577 RepID=UPI001F40E2C9|nr:EpsG family protein [Raoultella terrigena]
MNNNLIKCVMGVGVVFFLAVLAGSRYFGIDRDYYQYVYFYNAISHGEFSNLPNLEVGFISIAEINSFFGGSVFSFFVLYAFLAIGIKLFGIFKVSPTPVLSFIFYLGGFYFLHEMMQIRIGLASGFVFISFYYLVLGDKKRFFLLTLIGCIFHYSVLMSLFMALIPNRKKAGFIYLLLPLVALLFSLYNSFLSNSLDVLLVYFPAFIYSKVSMYIYSQENYGANRALIIYGFGGFFIYVTMFFLWIRIQLFDLNEYYSGLNLLIKTASLVLTISLILSFNTELSNRFYSYLALLCFCLLPAYVVNEFKQRTIILILLLIVPLKQLYTSYNELIANEKDAIYNSRMQ